MGERDQTFDVSLHANCRGEAPRFPMGRGADPRDVVHAAPLLLGVAARYALTVLEQRKIVVGFSVEADKGDATAGCRVPAGHLGAEDFKELDLLIEIADMKPDVSTASTLQTAPSMTALSFRRGGTGHCRARSSAGLMVTSRYRHAVGARRGMIQFIRIARCARRTASFAQRSGYEFGSDFRITSDAARQCGLDRLAKHFPVRRTLTFCKSGKFFLRPL
jgi:hypothetical protein